MSYAPKEEKMNPGAVTLTFVTLAVPTLLYFLYLYFFTKVDGIEFTSDEIDTDVGDEG